MADACLAIPVVNLSFGKITRIAEKQSLELRIELQNAFHLVHYGQPASARMNRSVFGAASALPADITPSNCCS
jgi:hypothetical protein